MRDVHTSKTWQPGSFCSESPACFQAYADKVWELLASLEAMDWEAERVRIAEQIAPLVSMDTRKPYADTTVAEYQQQMHWFVTERRIWLEGMLPPPSSRPFRTRS